MDIDILRKLISYPENIYRLYNPEANQEYDNPEGN